tara:strand:- start:4338 stop:5018 length:681 start_codon:yes stop_codon:yes gene_type:complete
MATNNVFDLTTGLVSYWQLGDLGSTIASDSFGSNDGTPTSLSQSDVVTGYNYQRNAVLFDGSADFVRVTDDSTLDITGDKTISAWIKLDPSIAANGMIVMKAIDVDNYYVLGWHTTDGFFLQIQDSTTNYVVKTNELSTGIWFHVVGTYLQSSNTSTIYLNAIDKSIASASTIGDPSDTNLTISLRDGQNDSFLNATIQDVMMWNSALSQLEIELLYDSQLKGGRI